MTKKIISMVISLLILVSCVMPFGTAFAADAVAKDFTFSADFNNLADGAINEADFLTKTGLTITQSGLSTVSDGVLNLYGSIKDSVNKYRPEIIYNLSGAAKKGTIQASVKVPAKIVEEAAVSGLEGCNVRFFQDIVVNWAFRYSNGKWMATNNSGNEYQIYPVAGADGSYTFRAVYTRADETAKWAVTLYNDSGAEPVQLLARESATTDAITSLKLIHLEPISMSGFQLDGDSSVVLDDISIIYDDGELDPADDFTLTANFDNLADGEINEAAFAQTTGLTLTQTSRSNVTDGVLNLYGTNSIANCKPDLIYNMNAVAKKGTFEISVTVPAQSAEKAGVEGYNIRFFPFKNTSLWAFRYSNGKWMAMNDAGAEYQIYPSAGTEDGSYTFRAVYTRVDETDNWAVTLYNDSNEEPVQLFTRTETGDITSLRIIHLEPIPGGVELGGDSRVLIDKVSIAYEDGELEEVEEDLSFKADFNNLEDGAIDEEAFAEATGLTIAQSGSSSISDGVLNLYGTNSISNRYANLIYTVPGVIKKGTFSVSLKVPAESVEKAGVEGCNIRFFKGIINEWAFRYSNGSFRAMNDAGSEWVIAPAIGADKSYTFRIVYTRETEEDDWAVTVYNDSGAAPVQMFTRTATGDITSLKLIELMPITMAGFELDGDASVLIDDVNILYDNGVLDEATSFAFKANFNNLASGAIDEAAFAKATGLTVTQSGGSSISNGALKLYGTNSLANRKPDLIYTIPGVVNTIPAVVKKGTLTASFKIPAESVEKAGVEGYNVRFFEGIIKDWGFRYSNGAWKGLNDNGADNYGEYAINPTKDAQGAYNFRIVYTRANETANWTVTIYNDSPDEPVQLVTTRTATADITSLKLIHLEPISGVSGELSGDASVLVDDVKITYYDGVNPIPEEEEETVEESNIEIDLDSLYLYNDDGDVESLAGLTEVTAEIDVANPKGTSEGFQMLIAAYDEDGRLIKFAASGLYTPTTAKTGYTVTLEDFADADEIKIFFVSDINAMRPIETVVRVTEVLSSIGFQPGI